MTSRYRFSAAMLLLGFAFLLYGCGNSSKSTTPPSNQPMDITSGTWTIAISPSGGGSNWSMTTTFTTFNCSNTNIALGPSWTIPGPLSATVCLSGSNLKSKTSGSPTPQGLIFGVEANPVPANGTTTMAQNTAYFANLDSSNNSDAYDLTGTFTAASKSVSGTYTCDTNSATCSGQTGTFSGTMN